MVDGGAPLEQEANYVGVAECCCAVEGAFIAFIEVVDGNPSIQKPTNFDEVPAFRGVV